MQHSNYTWYHAYFVPGVFINWIGFDWPRLGEDDGEVPNKSGEGIFEIWLAIGGILCLVGLSESFGDFRKASFR